MSERAFVYGRAFDPSGGGEGLGEQMLRCRAYAARCGMTVIAQAIDAPEPGLPDLRPGLAALVGAVESGGIDVVLVTELDRLSCRPKTIDYLLKTAGKLGVRVVTTGSNSAADQRGLAHRPYRIGIAGGAVQ